MREMGERFTEEIGVLEALGGDEEDLQLPVHHVCPGARSIPRSPAGCSSAVAEGEIQRVRDDGTFPLDGKQTRASVIWYIWREKSWHILW